MVSSGCGFCAWLAVETPNEHPSQVPPSTALGTAYKDWEKAQCTMEQSTTEPEQQGRGGCSSAEESILTNYTEESQANLAGKNSTGKAYPKPVETRQTMNGLLASVTELFGWLEAELIFLYEFIVLPQNSFLALQSS